jgi:phytoene dehydrogenase-like protein
VLLLVEGMHDWFAHLSDVQSAADTYGRRSPDYEKMKAQFEEMFLERLYKYYPLTRDHVTHIELSTPLTSEHFLNAQKVEAIPNTAKTTVRSNVCYFKYVSRRLSVCRESPC